MMVQRQEPVALDGREGAGKVRVTFRRQSRILSTENFVSECTHDYGKADRHMLIEK